MIIREGFCDGELSGCEDSKERILNKGLNPKNGHMYVLDDITNPDYRQAVEDYILKQTEGI